MGPRAGLPPLLTHLADRPPEQLQWLGVSFGLTQSLHAFWRRSGFSTLYLRQAPSDVTGRAPWLQATNERRRALLNSTFASIDVVLL